MATKRHFNEKASRRIAGYQDCKTTILKILFLVACGSTSYANAADWYGFNKIYTDTEGWYFDKSSIVKGGGNITLWTKMVVDKKSQRSNKTYSAAIRRTYFCSEKMTQVLFETYYDLNNNFIESDSTPGKKTSPIPDTIGEDLMKVICTPNFPNESSSKDYYRVSSGDIFSDNQVFFNRRRDEKNDPAPK